MAFSTTAGNGQSVPMSTMNTTPLVDVMLVLLIIFMIAAPLLAHRTDLKIPVKTTNPQQIKPEEPWTLSLQPGGQGAIFSADGTTVERSQLPALLRRIAATTPQPPFNLQADPAVNFDDVAKVVALAQVSGFEKIGFDDLRAKR